MLTDREVGRTFNSCFAVSAHTVIAGGAPEPAYYPARLAGARTDGRALIRYREDFVSSALHEIAHWCIAGAARRRYIDYGYWYEAPPRCPARQAAFFHAEVRAQALEQRFADACGVRFQVSADNLGVVDVDSFAAQVDEAAVRLTVGCMPARARAFLTALRALASR